MVAYRFDPDYTVAGRHYAHPLVQWSSIIAGAVAAIAVGFLLNVLGLAIGASAFNPFEINRQDETLSVARSQASWSGRWRCSSRSYWRR
jgi:hypothetical protein